MDPTITLILTAQRISDLTFEVVQLGEFFDEASKRTPLGQLQQITRFCAQLAVNAIRLESSRGMDFAGEIAAYNNLTLRIEAVFRTCLEAINRNR